MRLTTIWRLKGMTLQERLRRTRDEYLMPSLARAVPLRIQYWVMINNGVRYIGRSEEVPAVPYTEILQRMAARVERKAGHHL